MAQFRINILGCGSASPSMRHMPSCQVVDFRDNLFMIDCGEGAQLQLRRLKLKFQRLSHIFISHLHGDHVLGLPGLLSTLDLNEKHGSVTIHTFPEGIKILRQITDFFCEYSSFDILYEPVSHKGGLVFENDALAVKAFPLEHSKPCVGYLFEEKPKQRHLIGEMVDFYNVPISQRAALKAGADFVTESGEIIVNNRLTTDPDPSVSYAYCSDTRYMPTLAERLRGVDTIYHEATYDDSKAAKARQRGHSTAGEAAQVARDAGAKRLILGHFSKSYPDEEIHRLQASEIFKGELFIADEGMKIDLL